MIFLGSSGRVTLDSRYFWCDQEAASLEADFPCSIAPSEITTVWKSSSWELLKHLFCFFIFNLSLIGDSHTTRCLRAFGSRSGTPRRDGDTERCCPARRCPGDATVNANGIFVDGIRTLSTHELKKFSKRWSHLIWRLRNQMEVTKSYSLKQSFSKFPNWMSTQNFCKNVPFILYSLKLSLTRSLNHTN